MGGTQALAHANIHNLAQLHALQQGTGQVIRLASGLQLIVPSADQTSYSNAQIDDYAAVQRHRLPHRPPLRLTVRARFPTALVGTAGFGFWNSPLSPLGSWPALPAAIWFLHAAPPANIAPALGVAGHGWKAAVIDAGAPAALPWAPLAPVVLMANRIPPIRQRLWPRIQRALRVAERDLGTLQPNWQTYSLEWHVDRSRFWVGETLVLDVPYAPRGPLGFVAWVDTQWLIATPIGQFGWGLHTYAQPQWMDIESIQIQHLA
jgi:hypothetical protein